MIDLESRSRLEIAAPVFDLFSDEFPVLLVEFFRHPLEVIADQI